MDNLTGLALGRIVIGAAAFVAPERSLKSMMFDTGAKQSPYLLRLFGARDVALGALTLLAPPAQRPTLLKAGVAVDAADAVSGALALRSGAVGTPGGIALTAVGAVAAAAGVAALGQQRDR